MQLLLKELLIEGKMGPFHAGMTSSEILPLLGKPDIPINPQDFVSVWKYGYLELFIHNQSDLLCAICVYFGQKESSVAKIADYAFFQAMSPGAFESFLSDHALEHSILELLTNEDQVFYKIGRHLSAVFSRDQDALSTIQFHVGSDDFLELGEQA